MITQGCTESQYTGHGRGEIYRVRGDNLHTQSNVDFSSCMNATETCNTAMERQFCDLSESVQILNLRRLIKSIGLFKQNLSYSTYADLKSNFRFRGYLRPIWPLVLLGRQNNLNFVIYSYLEI